MVEEIKIAKGYKQTEVGVIPEDWEIDEIHNVAEITTGAKNTQDRIDGGKYPFFVRSQTIEKINSFSFDGEAVLTAGDGVGTGKVFHYINGKFDYHQRVYKVSNFSNRLNGYFFFKYFSTHFYNRIMQMTAKSSVDSVRRDMIAEMLIPLPPTKAEQTAIATALSNMDGLIDGLEKQLIKKRNIKQGAMQELLKPKEGWVEKNLGEIAEIRDGTHQTPRYVRQGVPFYSVENITANDFTNVKMISNQEHTLLTKNWKIAKGDILMTRIGSIGVCKYIDWDVNASFYVSLALLKVNKDYSAKFICHYSQYEYFKKNIILNSLQFAYPQKINLGEISKVKLIIPETIEEQIRLAQILSDMDSEIEKLETQLSKYKMIKTGMMQELLTGKKRLI